MVKSSRAASVLGTWEEFSNSGNILESSASLLTYLRDTEKARIQTVNLQHIYVASESEMNHDDLRSATKLTADGWPLAWYTQTRLAIHVDRVTGREALDLILAGKTRHKRLAIVGGSVDAGDHLQTALESSGRKIVYRNEGLITDSDYAVIVAQVAAARPDLVLTALGSPRGERLGRLLHDCQDIRAVVIGVGGAIEMWHGSTPGAPDWVQRIRGEWLYRLAREPRRLFGRYVLQCAPLMLAMLKRAGLGRRRNK